jgi:hypothetical protein
LGKQRGQHICSANASHKWLSASLAVWGQHICSANASHKWLSASLAVWGQHICSPNASHKWLSASLAVWGQHICSANASHKWLSASLAVWGVPNSIRSQNSFLTRKSGSFKALSRWILCTPKKTGAAKLTLQSKVLDPTALYFCLLVKVLNEMRL